MLTISSLAFMLTMFQRQTGGGIQQILTESFGFSATEFSIFGSIFFYPYMFMQIAVGILIDKIGVRKCVSAGLFLAAIGISLMAFSHEFIYLCIARLLIGVGVSYGVVAINKTANAWFPADRVGSAVSIANIPGSLGSALAQGGLAWLTAVFSWKASNLAIAAICGTLAAVCFFIYRESPDDGQEVIKPTTNPDKQSFGAALISLFRNPHTYPVLIMGISFNGCFMLYTNWAIAYFREALDLSNVEAASLSSISMLVTIFALLIIPPFAERIQSRKFSCIFAFACGIIVWAAFAFGTNIIVQSKVVLYAVIILFGINGICMPLCISAMSEVNDPHYVGTSVGIFNFVSTIGCIIVPMISGIILDSLTGQGVSFAVACQKMFIFPAILAAAGTIAALFMPETKCQNIYAG